MELHLHALFLVTQIQLLTIQLEMHAIAIQVTRYLNSTVVHGDVYLFATQQRQLWIQIITNVIVKMVIIISF